MIGFRAPHHGARFPVPSRDYTTHPPYGGNNMPRRTRITPRRPQRVKWLSRKEERTIRALFAAGPEILR